MKFVFVSETLRELAYEQLTFSIRRNLHKNIASWYEYTYPEQLDDFAVTLANHWERAGVEEKAMRASFKAAMFFFRVSNMSSAQKFAMKARDLLISQSGEEDMSEELKLLLSRIDILLWRAHYELVSSWLELALRSIHSTLKSDLTTKGGRICRLTTRCDFYEM